MKAAEEYSDSHGISYKRLMENAGAAVAEIISERCALERGIVVLCGNGNNGGDGFVIARLLAAEGIKVTAVMLCGEAKTELARYEYEELLRQGGVKLLDAESEGEIKLSLRECGVIADAVYGTGFHGTLPEKTAEYFRYACERSEAVIVGIDVPSGGSCYDGSCDRDTLSCEFTVTFGFVKTGMLSYPLDMKCGEILTADIGLVDGCVDVCGFTAKDFCAEYLRALFPPRPENSYKNMYGRLLVIAGCEKMSGAAAMSVLAALRSGTGLVELASVGEVISRVASRIYEPTFFPLEADESGAVAESCAAALVAEAKKASAVLIGCGLSVTKGTKKIVAEIMKNTNCPIIADADGINCIAADINIIRNTANRLIVTPHTGELKRLYAAAFGEAPFTDRFSAAAELAEKFGVTVVAKGTPSFVVGKGNSYAIKAGNPGLSRGGSGDVLAGITAGFAAQGLPLTEAAAAAVYVHGRAADIAAAQLSEQGMLPSDVIDKLPEVFRAVLE